MRRCQGMPERTVELVARATDWNARAAAQVQRAAERAVKARGVFTIAFSGGSTPNGMFAVLAEAPLPWAHMHVFQVDERVAPDGHADRNWTQLREYLLDHVPIPAAHCHPMPVTVPDLSRAAADYARTLAEHAGRPPVLDFVHLGLGGDGHTASLVPDDPALDVQDRDVVVSREYMGRRRLSLTLPALNRAREVLWLVAESGKRDVVQRLLDGDVQIPAGRVSGAHATLLILAEQPSTLRVPARPTTSAG